MTRLLVDGNGLACRLWWGGAHEVPQRFVNVIGEVRMKFLDLALEPFSDDGGPIDVLVAWDVPGGTWRREIMPSYKSGRPPKPQALVEALEACRMLPNFTHVEAPGFEADDIIATLALETEGDVLILSEDKDFAQLVTDRCRMVNARGEITTEADVERKWGVPPNRIRHLLSWMGDSSDGLPGVPRIGAKKAIPHALAGEIGDETTWELVGLATVPVKALRWPPIQEERCGPYLPPGGAE